MQYDRGSGQVYSEKVIRVGRPGSKLRGYAWAHESPFLPVEWEVYSPVGAHSLKHMAMRRLLSDQRVLTPAHFEGLPWVMVCYLWECVCRSKSTTLHLWKIFATACPTRFNDLAHRYLLKPRSKKISVRNYLKLLSSKTMIWSAVVSLSAEYIEPHEYLDIPNVPNLIGLEICSQSIEADVGHESPVTITDRIIKGWSEMALAGQAFRQLRILFLRRQSGISEHMFAYLDAFPLLRVFIMQECPRLYSKEARQLAEDHGWESSTVHFSCTDNLYRIMMDMGSELEPQSQEKGFIARDLPVVDFALFCRNLACLDSNEQILFKRKHKRSAPPSPQENKDTELPKPDKKQNNLVVKESRKTDMKGLLEQFKYASLSPFLAAYPTPED